MAMVGVKGLKIKKLKADKFFCLQCERVSF